MTVIVLNFHHRSPNMYDMPPWVSIIYSFYFLKVLKRSGLPSHSLKHFYTAAIRLIVEYCSVVWGHNLSNKQSNQLESIQKRAIRIIYQQARHMPYDSLLYCSNITDAPNKQKVSSHQFWTNLYAYNISSRSNVTMLLLLGCVQISCAVRQDK